LHKGHSYSISITQRINNDQSWVQNWVHTWWGNKRNWCLCL